MRSSVFLVCACLCALSLSAAVCAAASPARSPPPAGALAQLAAATRPPQLREQASQGDAAADAGLAPYASLHRATQRALADGATRSDFAARLGSIVGGLRAQSQLARLRSKYRDAMENATDAHAAADLPRASLPRSSRRARRHGNSSYALHPINLPPKSDAPSGLNFTTWVYPTKEGNVTIFIGIAEFPFGKYHIYPSPRPKRRRAHAHAQEPAEEADDAFSVHAMGSSSSHKDGANPILLELLAQWNPLCDGIAETSVSARFYKCQLAQNLGFFDMSTNACLGNVVSDGQWINHAKPDLYSHAHFGITAKASFVTGYLTPEETAAGVDGGFLELAQGSGWLVRNGKNHLSAAIAHEHLSDGFVMIKAPRNALAHDREGRLWMFQADGEEDIHLGLTLPEFADILTTHFPMIENAVNVDGGGSSTTVYEGEVADRPTCRDTPEICERAVTTISCLMH